ncbi:MAG: hypothetical protein JSS95_09145 [Acidobacteria bacterium]|nr:hypothetical protein [Acidobacteriota bacterium]
MEITYRGLWTLIHGMGFGLLFLLGCSAAIMEFWRVCIGHDTSSERVDRTLKWYLLAMTALAWLAVLSGAYIIYPWYRAAAPAGVHDLSLYPQLLLKSSTATAGWHSLGMEWKEHVAWIAPIAITMATAVFFQYGRELRRQPYLRTAVLLFAVAAFVSAGIAGFFGAMINKYAPTNGGSIITLVHPEGK